MLVCYTQELSAALVSNTTFDFLFFCETLPQKPFINLCTIPLHLKAIVPTYTFFLLLPATLSACMSVFVTSTSL